MFSAVTDHKNGTYTATFTGTLAGSIKIGATIGGSKLTSAAPTITVAPGAVSRAKSLVTLSPSSVSVGGTINVTLQAKDAYGNDETSGGLTVLFLLGSANGGQGTFGSVTDNGDGKYTATFTATNVGTNTIEVEIDEMLLISTPPKIKVTSN
jgi:adhesin/invasin